MTHNLDNRIKEAFESVHAESSLKASTHAYISAKLQKRSPRPYRRLAAAVSFCLLLCFGIGGYGLYFTQTSAISIDVNPSLEMGINRFDKVISVKGYNKDGKKLAASLDVRFQDYQDALDHLLSGKEMQTYLASDGLVSITVNGKTKVQSEKLLSGVSSCTAHMGGSVHCSSGNAAETEAAHAAGMSFGKYKAFLELQALDSTVTAEEVKDLTMRQIRDRIDALTGGSETSAPSCPSGHETSGECESSGCGSGKQNRKHQNH